MKNTCLFYLTPFFLILILGPLNSQKLNNIPIKRSQTEYFESEDIVTKFKIMVPDSSILKLINRFIIKGEIFDETQLHPLIEISEDDNKRLAGIVFVPIWKTFISPGDNQDSLFQTIGLRITLVAWGNPNDPNASLNFPGKIGLETLLTASENTLGDLTYDILFDENQTPPEGILLKYAAPYLEDELDSEIRGTREFDLVYLPIRDYWNLANGKEYYPNNDRPGEKGITIERSTSGFIASLSERTGSSIDRDKLLQLNFRSLIFRPYPQPNLVEQNATTAAIAFIQGKHCPPYWRNITDEFANLKLTFALLIKSDLKAQGGFNLKRLSADIFIGTMLRGNSLDFIDRGGVFFEFGLSYRLEEFLNTHRFGVQLLAGRYPTTQSFNIYGLNFGLSYTIPSNGLISNISIASRTKFLFSAGLGVYDLPSTLNADVPFRKSELGYNLGTAITYRLNNRSPLRVFGGLNFQEASRFTDWENPTPFTTLKVGLKWTP